MTVFVYPGSANTFAGEWPVLMGTQADGVVRALTGSAFALTASGVSPTVDVAAGEGAVAGFGVVSDSTVTLNLSTTGTQPTAGQERVDIVALQYDWSQPLNSAASIALVPGTPQPVATADALGRPALTNTRGVLWQVPLWSVRRPSGGLVTDIVDLRQWAVRPMWLGPSDELPAYAPLGTLVQRPGAPDQLRALRAGSPSWYQRGVASELLSETVSIQDISAGPEFRTLANPSLGTVGAGLIRLSQKVWIDAPGQRAGGLFLAINGGTRVRQGQWAMRIAQGTQISENMQLNHPGGSLTLLTEIQSGSGTYTIYNSTLSIWREYPAWV